MNTCPASRWTGAPGECVLPFGAILLAQQQHPPARSTSGASHRGPEHWALLLRVSPADGGETRSPPSPSLVSPVTVCVTYSSFKGVHGF